MMKYNIDIQETIVRNHTITVEVDDNISDEEFNKILDKAENESKRFYEWDAIEDVLDKTEGITVIETIEDDGEIEDIEIADIYEE